MEANPPTWDVNRTKSVQQRAVSCLHPFLMWPYVRRQYGREKLIRGQRYLFAANHVSLLDSLLLCGALIRAEHGPVLVLGDKNVWSTSSIRRRLSRHFGFLVERGKISPARMQELEAYGRKAAEYQLIVFPEGTRGNGVDVAKCQPGIFHISQAAQVPIVPVFLKNMHLVSTKTGRFHVFSGWRKIEIHFGDPIAVKDHSHLPREEFTEFIRGKILEVRDRQPDGPGFKPSFF